MEPKKNGNERTQNFTFSTLFDDFDTKRNRNVAVRRKMELCTHSHIQKHTGRVLVHEIEM